MNYDIHAKTKWTVRGDPSRTILQAWHDGVRVECPNKVYDEAKLDPETNTVLLSTGSRIDTVINNYQTERTRLKIPVNCFDCGCHHFQPRKCPNCGSKKWNLR